MDLLMTVAELLMKDVFELQLVIVTKLWLDFVAEL